MRNPFAPRLTPAEHYRRTLEARMTRNAYRLLMGCDEDGRPLNHVGMRLLAQTQRADHLDWLESWRTETYGRKQ